MPGRRIVVWYNKRCRVCNGGIDWQSSKLISELKLETVQCGWAKAQVRRAHNLLAAPRRNASSPQMPPTSIVKKPHGLPNINGRLKPGHDLAWVIAPKNPRLEEKHDRASPCCLVQHALPHL